jgi:hypothetical protein
VEIHPIILRECDLLKKLIVWKIYIQVDVGEID